MKIWVRRGLYGVAAVAVTVAVWAGVSNPLLFSAPYRADPDLAKRHDTVIRRDTWGVPHIEGASDADASFGLAYAHAEDDFGMIQFVVAASRARASEMAGMGGVGLDYLAHLVGVRKTVEDGYNTLSPDTRKLIEGYADGLNLYASKHPDEVKLAGLFPVTGHDIIAISVNSATYFSRSYQLISALNSGEPLPPTAPPKSRGGSNAFAISPVRSSDGSTWLISNSHQPWGGPFAWYEAHVKSREGLNFAGVLFPGVPIPVTGHNESLGWTNTSNYPLVSNVYRLELNEDGTQYKMDGGWKNLESRRIWLHVKFGPFLVPIPKTVYRSEHGPVIKNTDGAFAVRCSCFGEIRHIEQYHGMVRAQNFEQWHAAISMLAMPSFNYTYADKTGKIGLFYNAKFPHRPAGANWTEILPGNVSNNIWNTYWTFDDLPRIVDPKSGYIAESNSTPFQAGSGPQDQIHRADYPADFLIEPEKTNRSWRALELFDATPRVTAEDIYRIKFDTGISRQSDYGAFFNAYLARDYTNNPDLAAGQKLLQSWDWKLDGSHPSHALVALLTEVADESILGRKEYPDLDTTLSSKLAFLKQHYNRIDPPLKDMLRLRHGNQDLGVAGADDTLRAFDWETGPDGKLTASKGDSYIRFTRWLPNGDISAQSIQPFGSATNRLDSPHYADQAPLFAAGKFKPAWFSDAEVKANTAREYRPQ